MTMQYAVVRFRFHGDDQLTLSRNPHHLSNSVEILGWFDRLDEAMKLRDWHNSKKDGHVYTLLPFSEVPKPMISAIVAFDENRVMGRGNEMPWHIPDDFKHFKKATMGCPVVMGRKTWDSLPRKPLPGRTNIVLSKSSAAIEGAVVCGSLREAIVKVGDVSEMFIIGGRTIYQQALDEKVIDRLLVSHVKGTHQGDVYFPDIPEYLTVTDTEYPKYELFEVKEYRRKT